MDTKIAIELVDVTRLYKSGDQEIHALDHVSLDIQKGDFAVIAGPSGSGKTTLLNIIGGLDTPTSGQVNVDGRDIASMSRKELARMRLNRIGFVFQAYNLIPVLSAYENIEYPMLLKKVPALKRREKVMSLLKAVSLDGMENRRPQAMSGGQQQRVAIARSLVNDPVIVLADEPTANVDSTTAKALMELMSGLNTKNGTTFLFSTHDPLVMSEARRMIRLHDGKVESDENR